MIPPRSIPASLIALAILFPVPVHSQIVSDFEQDADGWVVADLPLSLGNPPTVNSYFAVTYSPTGGNPGGHIVMVDPTALWFHFSAPAKFLGDKSSYYGGRLTYDMSVDMTNGVVYPAVILVGAGKALYFPSTWPSTTFTPYDIPLLPAGWKVGDYTNGPEPTAQEMLEVLADLDALYIDGDWSNANETARLDNVRLLPPAIGPVPIGNITSLTYNPATQQVAVHFIPAANGQFQLESSPDLNPDPALWTPEGSPLAGSTANPLIFETTTTGESRKFFRVRSQ